MKKKTRRTPPRAAKPGICATRALKNARYLQRVAPDIMPATEPLEGFGSIIPYETLSRLHRPGAANRLPVSPKLQKALNNVPFPAISNTVFGPLFQGYLYFVRFQFEIFPVFERRIKTSKVTSRVPLPYPVISLSSTDVATAIRYASLASTWISDYARQYGPNQITVHQQAIDYSVALHGTTSYNDAQLQTWVNTIAQNLPSNACVVILNPPGMTNIDGDFAQGIHGYHAVANVPYIFVNLRQGNLTVADEQYVYAAALSHEIAEMTVDPQANHSNPEVCDPCDRTCGQTAFLDFFSNDAYITTQQAFPPSFPYAFFTAAIVCANAAGMCPAASGDCAYPPPFYIPPEVVLLLQLLLQLTGGNPPPTRLAAMSANIGRLATVRAIAGLARCLRDPNAEKAITAALQPIATRLEDQLKKESTST